MVAGCGANCMKYTLFFFNLLFFLAGVALVGVGAIAMIMMDSVVRDMEKENLEVDPRYVATIIAVVFMVTGFILMGICFFGCCGACKEIKCLLATYAILIGIVILSELAVIISMFVFRNKVEAALGDMDMMKDRIREYTGKSGQPSTILVDSIQQSQSCCGVDSWMDFTNKAKEWKQSSSYDIPISCCILLDKDGDLTESNLLDSKCPTNPTMENSYIGKTCTSSNIFTGILNLIFVMIVATVFGLIAIELIGLIFAVCLIRMISEPRAVPV